MQILSHANVTTKKGEGKKEKKKRREIQRETKGLRISYFAFYCLFSSGGAVSVAVKWLSTMVWKKREKKTADANMNLCPSAVRQPCT